MKDYDLIQAIFLKGRYEVVSDGRGNFTLIPIPEDAILICPDSYNECVDFFRKTAD